MEEIENNNEEKYRVSNYMEDRGGIEKIYTESNTNLICILAGTGSGKSYWVKNHLALQGRVLFVTSRSAKVLQDLNDKDQIVKFTKDFDDEYSTVCTNWALCTRIIECCGNRKEEEGEAALREFIDGYDYIVFDEFHSLVCDSLFNHAIFNVAVFFAYCVIKLKKKTIILTATRQPVDFFLSAIDRVFENKQFGGVEVLDLTDRCEYTLPQVIRVVPKNKTKNQLIDSLLGEQKKIIYFMNFVGKKSAQNKEIGNSILQEYEHLQEYGLAEDEIAVIVSRDAQEKWDKDHNCAKTKESSIYKGENGKPMQLTYNEWVRERIAIENEVPEGIKVVLCSATLNEGISIDNKSESPFEYVITDAHYISTLIQQMGRLRNKIKECWIINDARQHSNFNEEIQKEFILSKIGIGNSFLGYISEYAEGITDYKKRYDFIDWICKKKDFDLLAYSYLTHRFEFNQLRYKMREEVNRVEESIFISDKEHLGLWEKEIGAFAKRHDVYFQNSIMSKKLTELVDYVKIEQYIAPLVGEKLFGEKWTGVKAEMKALGLGASVKTINNALDKYGFPFVLNKNDGLRNGRYVYVFTRR